VQVAAVPPQTLAHLQQNLEFSVAALRSEFPSIPAHAKFPIIVKPNAQKTVATRGHCSSNVAIVMAGLATSKKGEGKPPKKEDLQRERLGVAIDIAKRLVALLNLPSDLGVHATVAEDGFINFVLSNLPNEAPSSSSHSLSTSASSLQPASSAPSSTATSSSSSTQPSSTESSSTSSLSASTAQSASPSTVASTPPSSVKKHNFKVEMLPASFIEEEYQIYRKYQISVHKDKPDKLSAESYTNFLVKSPLTREPAKPGEGPSGGYGSFHMQYRIDGRLVAVGVVDVLPFCLSSVYFFYDPDYSFLSLGVYSALHEIDWVIDAHLTTPKLKYYYMGFYIHTCPKMKYKGDYHPSDLLCLSSFQWVPLEQCLPLLNKTKAYVPFVADSSKHLNLSKEDRAGIIASISIWVNNNQIVHLEHFKNRNKKQVENKLLEFLDHVGPDLAKKLIYVLR